MMACRNLELVEPENSVDIEGMALSVTDETSNKSKERIFQC